MELLPAIDLLGAEAVRLVQGDFARRTSYGDPAELARAYAEQGASWLHVVDLAAARGGTAPERRVLARLIGAVAPFGVRVQLGGGVRSEELARELLGCGVERVVIGTAAVEDHGLVRRLAEAHPGRIAVGLDHRLHPAEKGAPARRTVRVAGWERDTVVELSEAIEMLAGLPLGAVVVTSIARDGMLGGPDLDGYAELLASSELPIVASGGVGSVADLAELAALGRDGRRLAGVVVGKALLDGRIGLAEALAGCA